jgi:hypothetical protein
MANAHDIDLDTPAAADIRVREMADKCASMSRKECQDEGNWGPSTQRLKEQSGVLHRYLDGSAVRITTRSFYQHLIDLANAPRRQGRKPSRTSFKKQRREPTEAERAGLRKANDARKADRLRREAAHAAVRATVRA